MTTGKLPTSGETVAVDLGGHEVHVPRGGLYDRYRMQTDLAVVAQDPRVVDVEFFRDQRKTEVRSAIGPTYTPNFYYAMSSARLAMLAPTKALRARLPRELDPLEVVPGFGLATVILFRYDVADIDFYTEVAVAIAVKPANHGCLGAFDLVAGLKNNHLHGYVLSLPVNTEIACVRGRDGYGFPKWVTDIDVAIDNRTVTGRVANDHGGTDIEFRAPTPLQKSRSGPGALSELTSYTRLDGGWHSTYSQTKAFEAGGKVFPRDVELTLGDGRVADDIRSLEPKRHLMFDVMSSGQLALHMPDTLAIDR